MGAHAESEVLTSEGRIDMVSAFSDKVYVMEFKCNQSADAAIQQIRDKKYAVKFQQSGKKVILLGINLIRRSGILRSGKGRWRKEENVFTCLFYK